MSVRAGGHLVATAGYHCVVASLLWCICTREAIGQTNWAGAGVPNNGDGAYCYDAYRDAMVFVSNRGDTFEMAGIGGWSLRATGFPGQLGALIGGIGYTGALRRVVAYDGIRTWHWNGSAWSVAVSSPSWSFWHIVSHEGRGTVMAFGGPNYWDSNDLYEWDGATWSLIPMAVKPPRPGDWNASRMYLTSAYDARRDKLIIYGSAWYDWSTHTVVSMQPDLWEWDAANGWVNRTVANGFIDRASTLYFDSQRGVVGLLASYPGPVRAAEWDGGGSWQLVVPTNSPARPALHVNAYGAYHPGIGRFLLGMNDTFGYVSFAYGSQNPAAFDILSPGCAGTLGEPTLRLTHNWTRAWMGRSLSIDLTNLPQSTGFVAMGWSSQQAGSFQLPLDLTPYGMPGCFARVATDLLMPVVGSNNTATVTMPVPQNSALLGVTLYQQGFALDPTANAAGLTAGNSVGVTIGRL